MTETVVLRSSGVKVVAKWTKDYGLSAATYANLTQANKRAEAVRAEGLDAKVIGRRPFYVRVEPAGTLIAEQFKGCDGAFQSAILGLAQVHDKPAMTIYGWWLDYVEAYSGQSALMFEFLQLYAEKLGPRTYPSLQGA